MGHQVNFYISMDDASELQKIWASVAPMRLLHCYSATSQPRVLDSVNTVEDGKPWVHMCLVPLADVENVVLTHVPSQKRWVVDVITSPVIEFTNSYSDGAVLRKGRLYFTDRYLSQQDVWTEKTPEFRSWASRLLTKTRAALHKRGSEYVGVGAEAFARDGGGLAEVYLSGSGRPEARHVAAAGGDDDAEPQLTAVQTPRDHWSTCDSPTRHASTSTSISP